VIKNFYHLILRNPCTFRSAAPSNSERSFKAEFTPLLKVECCEVKKVIVLLGVTNTTTYYSDYSKYFQEAYDSRVARNPSYSRRAFARDLGLATSTLTEVMKGKYGLSFKRAFQVAERMHLNESQCQHFAELFIVQFSRSEKAKKSARMNVLTRTNRIYQDLQEDAFRTISEWHHLALLELLEIEHHSYETTALLAERLDLPQDLLQESLQRLERLNLIEIKKDRLVPTGEFTTVGNGRPSEAVRNFHNQILTRAQTALTHQNTEEREFSSTVFSFSKKDLTIAKQLLQDFRREFATRFSKEKTPDDVFCLSIQFFSLLGRKKS
jgi:uncharacterized protein (TIGR02147 family)